MAADPLVGKTLLDRFEILERIGEGGTGVVYKAKQIAVDRDIAIKVLGAHVSSDPSWVKRFQNEARAAAKLHSPHTVQLLDFGQTKEGLLFIAMELLQGRSLRDELDKGGKMPPERALRITIQACESLQEAHNQGIIHRDIKPDNIYLDASKGPGDFVKVLDFSVAKMDTGDNQQTRAGIVFGTPAYMSPEQGRGAKLGPQSDIYALGIVLYEMLCGKPPFDSKIPTEVVMMHLRDKPQPLTSVPEPVNSLVMRALDKDPTRRQSTCEELANECQGVLAELFPHTTPSGMRAYKTGPVPLSSGGGTGSIKPASSSGQGQQWAASSSGNSGAPAQQMSGQVSGRVSSGVVPPPVASSQPGRQGAGSVPPPVDQRTMIADSAMAPSSGNAAKSPAGNYGNAQRPQQQAARPASSAQATMALDSPFGASSAGTMMLPDSQGVVAFALQQAEQARMQAAAEHKDPSAPSTPAIFWVGWAAAGIALGFGAHVLFSFLAHHGAA